MMILIVASMMRMMGQHPSLIQCILLSWGLIGVGLMVMMGMMGMMMMMMMRMMMKMKMIGATSILYLMYPSELGG